MNLQETPGPGPAYDGLGRLLFRPGTRGSFGLRAGRGTKPGVPESEMMGFRRPARPCSEDSAGPFHWVEVSFFPNLFLLTFFRGRIK